MTRFIFLSVLFLSLSGCNAKKNANHVPVSKESAKLDGEQLFKLNCSQCHKPTVDFTAPSLAGVESRWKSKTLLYDFVRSSEDVIARDAYAMTLYKKWNLAYMQPFTHLTNEDIDAILAYCNTGS